MSTKEAAKILGVGVSTLKRWELEGKIRAKKTAGGHRTFHKTDVAMLLGKTT
ncbi:MAG TPA: helix-turn-helix domain-containing protein [Pseudobdellovibrionaceae bacterium]|nr:helix-turn-helix domain-containing protein [Pseudobdellovibrionaceae bacterium]